MFIMLNNSISFLKNVYGSLTRPVAQLVVRWSPGGESPGSRRSDARYMKLLAGIAQLMGAAAAR